MQNDCPLGWSESWNSEEEERDAGTCQSDYLCHVTQRIGLKMSPSSSTYLSVLSGVRRRLPNMPCCCVATALAKVKFSHRPGEERQPIILRHVLWFPPQSLMDNITLSIHSRLATLIILLLFIAVQMF